MNNRTLALLAAFVATSIYGLNHTIAKGLMPTHIGAFGLILARVVGASILFWLISFWGPKAVSYTHLRAHETRYTISYSVLWL